ncbi:hypothetical protein M141_4183 [Bacteroides fragilis str. S38L5]|nr:hypothetical protein M141_4183 [Bacteroides fragilis str. S38L5]EYB12527.1 hypothetical protein M140_4135 [Bacteroides fragilis str. S38L3]
MLIWGCPDVNPGNLFFYRFFLIKSGKDCFSDFNKILLLKI